MVCLILGAVATATGVVFLFKQDDFDLWIRHDKKCKKWVSNTFRGIWIVVAVVCGIFSFAILCNYTYSVVVFEVDGITYEEMIAEDGEDIYELKGALELIGKEYKVLGACEYDKGKWVEFPDSEEDVCSQEYVEVDLV